MKGRSRQVVLIALAVPAWLVACGGAEAPARNPLGDPVRGKIALRQYACTACHVIPGMVDAKARVGPSLERWASRAYIAGFLPNTPDNLVDWIRHPQRLSPGNAMPDLDVSERDAWNMAAYLYAPK